MTDGAGTVFEAIRQWADRQPDAPALVAEGRPPTTFGALVTAAAQFRRALNASGLGRGDRIALVHPGGVDMAVDSSGKATHLKCIKSLARGGGYVTPGCTSGPDATTDLARVFWNQLRVVGSTMGSNDEFQEVTALFRTGKIGAAVDTVFSPRQAQEAWSRLEGAEQFGKVVIDWTR